MNKDASQINKHKSFTKEFMIITAIVALVVVVLMYLFRNVGSGNTNTDFSQRFQKYNDGWTLIIDDKKEIVDLPEHVKTGEDNVITLKKQLPASIAKYSVIATRNYHQKMDVFIDGRLVYSYPEDYKEGFSLLSDTWCIIPLQPTDYRSTLEIRLTNVTLRPLNNYIYDIYLGDDNSIIEHLKSSVFWPFISGVVMICFGFFLLGISFIYRKFTNQKPNTPMGLLLLCIGVWLCNRTRIPYFSSSNGRIFVLSLVALMFTAPFFFLYINRRNQEEKKLSIWCFRINLALVLLILITSPFIRYNPETLAMISYATIFLAIILHAYALGQVCFGEKSKNRLRKDILLDRTEFFGSLLFPIGGFLEIIVNSEQLWTDIGLPFRVFILAYSLMYMITIFWRTYLVAKDRMMVTERLQESQLELMMGQIQPHFIFNTLSSIRTLVRIDPDVAYNMLYDFSNYLRANVDNVTNLDGIQFSAEVNHIKSYVNIEKVRFGDRLHVEYDIGEGDFVVPPLSIQPLVENAIKHGVVKKMDGGTVTLRSYEEENYNVVVVEDTGIGFNQESASRVFSVAKSSEDGLVMESNQMALEALNAIKEKMVLLDEEGNPIVLQEVKQQKDLSGNGSEEHKSKGMMNIFMRLREMSDAEIEIFSQEGKGTTIKVMFPKAVDHEKHKEELKTF